MSLRMAGIGKRFGATTALTDVELEVATGEVVALVGENGSGKSTLMRILAGAVAPDSGTMTLEGAPYAPQTPAEARRAGIAMIHQELALCGHLDIAENIMLGIESPDGRQRASRALAELGYEHLDLATPVRNLPIGVRQIVEIARAIVSEAKVIVLDEPTSSLTSADAERLYAVVRQLRGQGRAIIFISHFLEEVRALADRIVVLRDGARVAEEPAENLTTDALIRLMVGRTVDDLYPRSARTPGELLLELNDLSGLSKPIQANLSVCRGEVVGLAGLNGAGRTELIRAIFGLDRIRSGEIRVGIQTGWKVPAQRWAQGVGMLSEDRKEEGLALNLSLAENATLPCLPRWVSPKRQETRTQRWIDELGVRCQGPGQRAGTLSGGNQQKIALARLLEADVDLWLLDEPTRGIDVGSKQTLYARIDAAARVGKGILLASSYLPELLGVCDRIAVMTRGRLGSARPVAELDSETLMREAVAA
jgi:ribose transport system ATP-binding protein